MTITRKIKLFTFFLFTIISKCGDSFAQSIVVIDSPMVAGTTVVIAGDHYKRSGYHNLFWGKHYRKEWSTPVRVKNFLLDTAKGGLTPVKPGGSRQTKGLRLKSGNGKEYVLRSIDKDFGRGLGEKYEGTFIAKVAKDQASIGHPFAAATVGSLISATDIYHTNPQIVFVPHQSRLGIYNEEYGDQLYLFEERPDENQEDAPWFGNSKNVIGTEKLWEHIYEDNDYHVDQKSYAKARLFDMFIGDWGRHADQWRWASFKEGKSTIYKPIPRDRDQAFTKFDGFWPWMATNFAGPGLFLEKFDDHLNNVERFNKPAYPLDKYFLNELTKEKWQQAATELKTSLTDEVIDRAVAQMPPGIREISGKSLAAKLKSRRDDLEEYAVEYYDFLAKRVVLTGSQKTEVFEISGAQDGNVKVEIYKKTKDGEVKPKPYYSRVFDEKETATIQIYSLEGNDEFKVDGDSKIKITLIDPDRSDKLATANATNIKTSSGERYWFDTLDHKKFDFSIRPLLSPSEYNFFDNDPLELFTRVGAKICFNFRLVPKPWQKAEYRNEHLLNFSYGFLRNTFAVAYVGQFRRLVGKWDLQIKTRADIPAVENFFGVSNETTNTKTPVTYYKTTSTRLFGGVGLYRNAGIHHFEFGPFYQYIKVSNRGDHILTSGNVDPSVFGANQFGGFEAGYQLKKTDNDLYPTRGFHFKIGGGYVQNINTRDRSFWKGNSSLAFYLPITRTLTFAVRGGGAVLDGKADYYHLNTLGGNENLRGYPRERFYGTNSFYNNNELRWVFNTHNFLFTGKMGFIGFFDNGRVWQPGEVSNTWHSGYGGGLILIPFNKVVLAGTYGMSKETTHLLLQAQVFF